LVEDHQVFFRQVEAMRSERGWKKLKTFGRQNMLSGDRRKTAQRFTGSTIEPAVPGLVQNVKGPLKLCSARALHATLDPAEVGG